MSTVTVDYSKICGKVKPMHAVNNGPVKARGDQVRGNFDTQSRKNTTPFRLRISGSGQ